MINETKLLHDWESIFRQGLLTFWVFVVLKSDQLTVTEILKEITTITGNTYHTSEQALYRMLRKQYDLELVDYTEAPGKGGPNRKVYSLSSAGERILMDFSSRNIALFHQPRVKNLLKKGKK